MHEIKSHIRTCKKLKAVKINKCFEHEHAIRYNAIGYNNKITRFFHRLLRNTQWVSFLWWGHWALHLDTLSDDMVEGSRVRLSEASHKAAKGQVSPGLGRKRAAGSLSCRRHFLASLKKHKIRETEREHMMAKQNARVWKAEWWHTQVGGCDFALA